MPICRDLHEKAGTAVTARLAVTPSPAQEEDHIAESTATSPAASTDIARAFAALKGKQAGYERLWQYYSGDHPLVYTNPKLHSLFRRLDARWFENWCSVVINALVDRVQLKGFKCADAQVQAALDEWWDTQDVSADAEEIVQSVALCNEAFYLAEVDDEGQPQTFSNKPYLCAVLYHEGNPKRAEFAAKWWEEGEKLTRLNLYYADRVEHYTAQAKRCDITAAGAFAIDGEEPNPWGKLPIFHFRRSRDGTGELTNVIPVQNANNKLLADMMVASEYGAYKQRYIISQVDPDEGNIQNDPTKVWKFPAGDGESQPTSVGEFSATELENFIRGLDHFASVTAVISSTPKHYIMQQGELSGEALLAMEAPLVKKADPYRKRLTVTWKHAAAFVMQLAGHTVSPNDIECVWEDEHTVQPLTEADIYKRLVEAGIPLTTVLRRDGWSEEELDQMAADGDEAEARGSSLADVALAAARKRFDQGAAPGPYQPEPES